MSTQADWRGDLIVVGGGPAGSVCAAICAGKGLRVAVIERAHFPREKVCGDCLNPRAWATLNRLGIAASVNQLPHAELSGVDFISAKGQKLNYAMPAGSIAVKRSHLDALLLTRAREAGAEVTEGSAVTAVERLEAENAWHVQAGDRVFIARNLVAADGRNSTVARLLGLLPTAARDRVGVQTHIPLPDEYRNRVALRFLSAGYCGVADVGGDFANVCLVSTPQRLDEIKRWAESEFSIRDDEAWRCIAPLARPPATSTLPGLLLAGDAARVVEPFTGEGIYYALASGELAANCIVASRLAGNSIVASHLAGDSIVSNSPAQHRGLADYGAKHRALADYHKQHRALANYAAQHRALYRGRIWVNRLARFACEHPTFAAAFLSVSNLYPPLLGALTGKVTRTA